MSKTTQNEFERLVVACFQQHANALRLSAPIFSRDGYVITATMAGIGGNVELRCGPAEYSTEVFICTSADGKRWSLADLFMIHDIRTWMLQNRPNLSGKSRLEAEVTCAFSLLAEGLKGIHEFLWLSKNS